MAALLLACTELCFGQSGQTGQGSSFQIPSPQSSLRTAQFQSPGTFPPAQQAPLLNFPNSTLQLPPVGQTPNNFRGFQTPFPIQPGPSAPPVLQQPPAQLNLPNFGVPNNPTPPLSQGNPNFGMQSPLFGPRQSPQSNGLFSGFFQQQPNNGWQNSASAWPSQFWARLRNDYLPRLFETPRYRHTWVQGNNGNELGLNEVELATTMTIPRWLNSTQPLRLTPGFTFLFWDGPDTAATGFDLPSRTYSAFLAADFVSDPNRTSGIETNLTVGVYSDFDNLSSDSLRITGLDWVGIGSIVIWSENWVSNISTELI